MFGKKKKEVKQEEPVKPKKVMAGSEDGINIGEGDHNDPNRKVVMKQSYVGIPDKDFKFKVDESMVSVVYTEDGGYLDEYKVGNVQPSDYWDKKFLGKKPKEVSILSFSDKPFTIGTGTTVRVPGGNIDGTIWGNFKFKKEDPRAIASLLLSTYAKEETKLDVRYQYITGESLEIMIRTAFQNVIRQDMFVEEVDKSLEDIEYAILQKVKDTPFFVERSIDVSQINIRFEQTEMEKLADKEVEHKVRMREAEMEKEYRDKAIDLAKSESESFKEI